MDITPHVNLLKSLRGERVDYVLLIGEAIDNAFDAGASRIDIALNESMVKFTDDGCGITRNRIASIFSLGDHGPMTTTQLGRFGVGIKSQAVNAGDVLDVFSTSVDGRVRLAVNWREILKSGHWEISDPRWFPVMVGAPTGTTLTISALRNPPRASPEKIAESIALRFYPALIERRRITLNKMSIEPLAEPQLTDVVECKFSLSKGRGAALRAGILAAPSKLNRVHVAYKHRVIMPASTFGCADYGGLSKMFARLQLDGPWHLAKFKDNLTDEIERDELEDVVAQALVPILEKCNSASLSAKIMKMSEMLNEMMPEELAGRPKRQRTEHRQGRKDGRQGSVDLSRIQPDSDSPAKVKRSPQDRLIITFDGMDAASLGDYEPGRPNRVNLSKAHPVIAELIEHRDEEMALRGLYSHAMYLFEQGRENRGLQFNLPFDGTFGERVARLLAIQDSGLRAAIAQ